MSWITVIQALIALASAITAYLQRNGTLDAANTALLKGLYESELDKIHASGLARANVSHDPAVLLLDPNNRSGNGLALKDGH